VQPAPVSARKQVTTAVRETGTKAQAREKKPVDKVRISFGGLHVKQYLG